MTSHSHIHSSVIKYNIYCAHLIGTFHKTWFEQILTSSAQHKEYWLVRHTAALLLVRCIQLLYKLALLQYLACVNKGAQCIKKIQMNANVVKVYIIYIYNNIYIHTYIVYVITIYMCIVYEKYHVILIINGFPTLIYILSHIFPMHMICSFGQQCRGGYSFWKGVSILHESNNKGVGMRCNLPVCWRTF